MKLLNYTSKYFAFLLFFVLTGWAVIFYFQMLDEIYDSMDDGLENQKMLVIRNSKQQDAINIKPEFGDGYYTLYSISERSALGFKDSYRDTLMYMQNEKDYEPVRLLESVFKKGDEYYKVKIITSMVEEDDLIEDLLFSIIWLYLGLIFSIIILNNLILKKVWNPFYKLIGNLRKFKIENDTEIELPDSKIEEFNILNENIQTLISKSVKSYRSQKQFIENASHELQTPIAISINKLELLLEDNGLEESQANRIISVIENLERLSRFNQSLLLLSKIENKQFPNVDEINFNELTQSIVADFEDLLIHRNIEIEIESIDELNFSINPDLAQILLTNLIKNAILHNADSGKIKIRITSGKWQISNPGKIALIEKDLFARFQKVKDNSHSSGLGLAISRAIAELYQLELSYTFGDAHIFKIDFPQHK
ncbi:sensor histidine kinase [Christiangramia sediminis]|uniref:histidine kinase n=1 Tax=Christiangramia sediminis TaxID=2881336 RepID=A0A9X1RV50_9FLAO|nr:HAMP domain-containing sensor histidine kinase [Christiangramia sediminis]MCB7479794.1 HAMP domain-containing histidine kinase [Christiangramia sediminis]